MSVPILTPPLQICYLKLVNFLAGRSVAWIHPYSLIYSYMKTGQLWQLSTIAIKSEMEGGFLYVGGEENGFCLEKQLKVNTLWSSNKWGEWE